MCMLLSWGHSNQRCLLNLRTTAVLQARVESLSVSTVCAGVCKHAELPTCFLSENMVRSGCQGQPRALPAAATVRLQGTVLDGTDKRDRACGEDRKGGLESVAHGGGVALLALTNPKTGMASGRSKA